MLEFYAAVLLRTISLHVLAVVLVLCSIVVCQAYASASFKCTYYLQILAASIISISQTGLERISYAGRLFLFSAFCRAI